MKLFQLIISLFALSAFSCNGPAPDPATALHADPEAVNVIVSGIADGALALRKGNDITSNILAQLNTRDRRFSHIGICFVEDGEAVVYHSLGSEYGGDQYIRKERADVFFNLDNNLSIGYAKTTFSAEEKEQLHRLLKIWYQQKIPFDMNFDLQTDDSLYCSEMVAKAIMTAIPNINIGFTDTFGRQYYAVDDITTRPIADSIRTYSLSPQDRAR